MLRLVLQFFILGSVVPLGVFGQTVGINAGFGYTLPSISFSQLGSSAVPMPTSGLSLLASPCFQASVSYDRYVMQALEIFASAGLGTMRLGISGVERVPFIVGTDDVEGQFLHTFSYTTTFADAAFGVRWNAFDVISIEGALGSLLPINSQYSHNERITAPSDATYVDGTNERVVVHDEWLTIKGFVPYIEGRLALARSSELKNDAPLYITPYLSVRASLGSVDRQDAVSYLTATVGVRIGWNPGLNDIHAVSEAPLPIIRSAPVDGTIKSLYRPPVFATQSVAVRNDNMEQRSFDMTAIATAVDSVFISYDSASKAYRRVVRTDTILFGTSAAIVIRPIVTSDDALYWWTVKVIVDTTVATIVAGKDSVYPEIFVPMAQLPYHVFTSTKRHQLKVVTHAVNNSGNTATSDTSRIDIDENRTGVGIQSRLVVIRIPRYSGTELPADVQRDIEPYASLAASATSISISISNVEALRQYLSRYTSVPIVIESPVRTDMNTIDVTTREDEYIQVSIVLPGR